MQVMLTVRRKGDSMYPGLYPGPRNGDNTIPNYVVLRVSRQLHCSQRLHPLKPLPNQQEISMAISARTRPEFIISGAVSRSREISKKDSGEVLGCEYTVSTSGGDARVTAWASDTDGVKFPAVGGFLAAVVSVNERDGDAQLVVRRLVNANDLDFINSNLPK